MKRTIAIIALVAICLSACSNSSEQSESTSTTRAKPTGRGEAAFEKCSIFECATIKVPLDYNKPDGRLIDIEVMKVPARVQADKLGVILMNPGGPGQSGINYLRNAGFIFSPDILDRFDIVSWDPRGVGSSTKLTCARNLDPLFEDIDYSPDNKNEEEDLIEAYEWFADACEKDDAQLMRHLSTMHTVKDLDSIRIALGEEKINYLGYSYGTSIGQIYATQFPDKVRTMVLDGVVNIGLDPIESAKGQAKGFRDAIDDFFNYCQGRPCEFAGEGDPEAEFLKIMNDIDEKPIPSKQIPGLELGPAQFDLGVSQYLYGDEDEWRALDRGLANVKRGDPETILVGFSNYTDRRASGNYGTYTSFLTIGCADGRTASVEKMFDLANELGQKDPIYGKSGILLGLPCSLWPNAQDAEPFDVESDVPAIFIGTTGDPATPVQWARDAAKKFDNGVYVEYVGQGHTIYGQGSQCVNNLVNEFFLSEVLPKPTTCRR